MQTYICRRVKIQNCSPYSLQKCTTCDKIIDGIKMPVPQQVHEAAVLLKFPFVKVYGSGWLDREDTYRYPNLSIQMAEKEYAFESDTDDTISESEQFLEDSDEDECSWDEGSTDSEKDALSDSSAEEEEDVSTDEEGEVRYLL